MKKKFALLFIIIISTLFVYGLEMEYVIIDDVPESAGMFLPNGYIFYYKGVLFSFDGGGGPWYYIEGTFYPVTSFVAGKEFNEMKSSYGTVSECIIPSENRLFYILWNIWNEEPFYACEIEVDRNGNVSVQEKAKKDIDFEYRGITKSPFNRDENFDIYKGSIELKAKKYMELPGWYGYHGLVTKADERTTYNVEVRDSSRKILFSTEALYPNGVIRGPSWVAVNEKRNRIGVLINFPEQRDAYKIVVVTLIYEGKINDNRVRMRGAPNLEGKTIGYVNRGDVVKIVDRSNEKQKIGDMESYWYKVQTEGYPEGWVYGAYIEVE